MATLVGVVNSIQGQILITGLSGIAKVLIVGDTLDSDSLLSGSETSQTVVVTLNNGQSISLAQGQQWQSQKGVFTPPNSADNTSASTEENSLEGRAADAAVPTERPNLSAAEEGPVPLIDKISSEIIAPTNAGESNPTRSEDAAQNSEAQQPRSPAAGYREGHSEYRVSRAGDQSSDSGRVTRTAEEIRPLAESYSNSSLRPQTFNNTFSGLSYNSSFQSFRDAFYKLFDGGRVPSLIELRNLGISGLTVDNISGVQHNIINNKDNIHSLLDLQNVTNEAIAALMSIVDAAGDNSASGAVITLDSYRIIGVTGVTSANQEMINSVFNQPGLTGSDVNTVAEIQAIVDSYNLILLAADGIDNDAVSPAIEDYTNLGISGVDSAFEVGLLGELLDIKSPAQVNTVSKIQQLADAVQALQDAVAGAAELPTQAQLERLGFANISADTLAAVQQALRDSADDGSAIQTLAQLQSLVNGAISSAEDALQQIQNAAHNDSANAGNPTLGTYSSAGISGVNGANLASINSVLNDAQVGAAETDSFIEIQAIVDSYNIILTAADGSANNATKPSQQDYINLGISGIDSSVKASLLGDVLDSKNRVDVDSVSELQLLADAISELLASAAGAGTPSQAQLELLGITGITVGNMPAILNALAATEDDGSDIAALQDLQTLIYNTTVATQLALTTISDAAQNDSATLTSPDLATYISAGISGISNGNLAAINSALNSASITGTDVDTVAEIQAIVDTYNKILAAADGIDDDDSSPTQSDYSDLGISGIDTANEVSLLGDVIDTRPTDAVQSLDQVQALADAVQAVMDAAAGTTGAPSSAQLTLLGLNGVTDDNLIAVQNALQSTSDDGSAVASLDDLNSLVNTAISNVANALASISAAAQADSATDSTPALSAYLSAGVTGISGANLAAINSALNSAAVNGEATNSREELQALVDSYNAILTVADGIDNDGTSPSLSDYATIGVIGIDSAGEVSLLGDVLDEKSGAEVDTLVEMQALADAVQAVMNAAADATGTPSRAQLTLLGLSGVTHDNLIAVQNALQMSSNDGSAVANIGDLHSLVNSAVANAATALTSLSGAAQGNSASSTSPGLSVYGDAGVSGVNATNLAAINSALNSAGIDGNATDSTAKIQALVDSYAVILNAADGSAGEAAPSQSDYANLGITGMDDSDEVALLGEVIDRNNNADVDSIIELQVLADAVQAVMDTAAMNSGTPTGPSLAQLTALGISGVTSQNLAAIQQAILASSDDGSAVNSLSQLQAIATATSAALDLISAYTGGNATPNTSSYTDAQVSGVNSANLSAINDAIAALSSSQSDTQVEVQAIVDSYAAILNAADGSAGETAPLQADYANIGITGMDDSNELALLGEVIDRKVNSEVDSISEVQNLADAVQAVMNTAAMSSGTPSGPSLAQLTALGISGVTNENLSAIQQAILTSADDGSAVNSVSELQAMATLTATALDLISAYTGANTAPTTSTYSDAQITGVAAGNLAAVNDAMAGLSTSLSDSHPEVQAVVDSYAVILNAADGSAGEAAANQSDYSTLGITGMDDVDELALLGDVIDRKTKSDVDSISELQSLADAVQAVMDAAALNSGTAGGPSLAQLTALGLTGVTAE
ncbi:MAG: hypothetical protein HRU05_10135, partial [Oceanospirillaceae bacterium]|nr:hypothetical protein [Oceanospirillaceae bacterium]